MNQRIKLLALQAGGNPNYSAFRGHFLPPPPDYIDPATVDLAKFAELIVQECITAIYKSQSITPGFLINLPPDQLGLQIKKHFGVDQCQ